MTTQTARHAQVGDRLRLDYTDDHGRLVTGVITVDRVTRLGCGCDRAEAYRPGCTVFPRVHVVPSSCHHTGGGIDFDQARIK